jgi:hypothetical protein
MDLLSKGKLNTGYREFEDTTDFINPKTNKIDLINA